MKMLFSYVWLIEFGGPLWPQVQDKSLFISIFLLFSLAMHLFSILLYYDSFFWVMELFLFEMKKCWKLPIRLVPTKLTSKIAIKRQIANDCDNKIYALLCFGRVGCCYSVAATQQFVVAVPLNVVFPRTHAFTYTHKPTRIKTYTAKFFVFVETFPFFMVITLIMIIFVGSHIFFCVDSQQKWNNSMKSLVLKKMAPI